ncbi:MAG: hypothetical protein PHT59_06205 [Candidatus Omnitrophica bacterium]|nr:hypothetical protein [Candidatus Omnitrophota bacterium]
MKIRSCIFTVIIAGLVCVAGAASAQQPAAPAAPVSEETPPSAVEPIPEWLYGEIAAVNVGDKSFQVKYIDFDKDIEKQATIYADKQTVFSGVASLDDLKLQDIVNVDYVIDPQGKNIAVAVSVEKPEDIEDIGISDLPGELKDAQPLPREPESAMPEGTSPAAAGAPEETPQSK